MKWLNWIWLWVVALACLPVVGAENNDAPNLVTVVDLLVVYTPAARQGAGGQSAIEAQIQEAMREANLVLLNSRVWARIHLVHVQEIAYQESGFVTNDLARLQTSQDGFIDEVHALRDQYAADLVCLVIEGGRGPSFDGLPGPSAANAFSIICRAALRGRYYFPVALSFNFGCQLERPYAERVGAFPYAYGFSYSPHGPESGEAFATVDSLAAGRLPWFSNPAIEFEGVSCGNREGEPNAANNAKVLNQTAPIVAAFRGAAPKTTPPTVAISNLRNGTTFYGLTNVMLSATASDPDGQVVQVGYYANDQWIGSVTNAPWQLEWACPFQLAYSLTAVATDNQGAATVSAPVLIHIGPINDDFSQALALSGPHAAVLAWTHMATAEPDEPFPDVGHNGQTLWWSYTPPSSGVVQVSREGSIASTIIVAYTGDALANLSPVFSLTSWMYPESGCFYVTGGVRYFFQVDTMLYPGLIALTLDFTPAPPNDHFPNATVLFGTNVSVGAEIFGASLEAGEPSPFPQYEGASLWWKWTAPSMGRATLKLASLFTSGFAVYQGTDVSSLAAVLVSPTVDLLWPAEGQFYVRANESYYICANSGQFTPNTIDLSLSFKPFTPAPNDDFTDRLRLFGNSLALTNSNEFATAESGDPLGLGQSLWWQWTAPGVGTVDLSVKPLSSEASECLAVFTGTDLPNLAERARSCQSVWFGAPGMSLQVQAGEELVICLDGPVSENVLGLNFHPRATNDDFGARIPLAGARITVPASNFFCTREPGEPQHDRFNQDYVSGWWTWTAPASGMVKIWTQDLPWAEVAVCTGASVSQLTRVAWGAGAAEFPVTAGTTYQIAVADKAGTEADFTLYLKLSTVQWASPAPDQILEQASPILLSVLTTPLDGQTAKVDYFLEGPASESLIGSVGQAPFTWTWTNAPAGQLLLRAKVTDTDGVENWSPLITLRVRPSNDDFINRVRLSGEFCGLAQDNTYAAAEAGEPAHTDAPPQKSVWWEWASPGRGVARIYFNARDPKCLCNWGALAVYTGSSLDHLTQLGSAKSLWCDYPAALSFLTEPDATYLFAFDSQSEGPTGIEGYVQWNASPANDDFADRVFLAGDWVQVSELVPAASQEPGEPVHAGDAQRDSVWWSWVAPARGRVTLTKPWADLLLAVYTGSPVSNLVPVAYTPLLGPYNYEDSLSFRVEAQQEYQIAGVVESGWGQSVDFTLSFESAPANDDFTNRTVLEGINCAALVSNTAATKEPGEPDHAGQPGGYSVWWTWTAPASGQATLIISNASAEPFLAAYTGTALTNLTPVASAATSNLTFDVIGGMSYELVLDSACGCLIDALLGLRLETRPVNDPFTNRLTLAGSSIALVGNNTLASLEPQEPLLGGADGKTLWWTWTAPGDGTALIIARTNGEAGLATLSSSFLGTALIPTYHPPPPPPPPEPGPPGHFQGPLVGIYSGEQLPNLTLLASNSVYLGDPWLYTWGVVDELRFPALAGATYHIAVDSCNGSAGDLALNLVFFPPPPNDAFVLRTPLSGTNVTVEGYNHSASKEIGEPNHAGQSGGASVWWQWTAPLQGRVTIQVNASFTNLLAAYSGMDLQNLNPVASGAASLMFFTEPGRTYVLAIDGEAGAQGRFDLSLVFEPQPANDQFSNATDISGTGFTIEGTTFLATREPGEPEPPGANHGPSVWYRWQAPSSGSVSVRVINWPSGTIDVFVGSSVADLLLVSKSSQPAFSSETGFYAVAGQVYYLAVSDASGRPGAFEFTLAASPPFVRLDPTSLAPPINGPFVARLLGVPGQSFGVQVSTNLMDWNTITIDTLQGEVFHFHDDTAPSHFPLRFYRFVPLDALFSVSRLQVSIPTLDQSGNSTVRVAGPAGQPFRVRASADLATWLDIFTGLVIGDSVDVLDTEAGNYPARFYQTVPLPPAP